MITNEELKILLNESDDSGEYNPSKDSSNYNIDDERKPVLTLADLNRLKAIRLQKRKELMQDNSFIPVLYGPQPEEEIGMGGGAPF